MPNIIIASGPVIVENGRVLLNKNQKDDFWKFCGGQVEDIDNDLKETAKREAFEEMGIKIRIIDEKPFLFYTEKETDKGLLSIILVHFLAERSGDIIKGDDTSDWAWLEIDKLSKEKLGPNVISALRYFKLTTL